MALEDQGAARGGFAVTPHDSTNFTTIPRALWVGTQGNLVALMLDDTVVTFVGVVGLLPISCKRVNSTNTTAADIVGLY